MAETSAFVAPITAFEIDFMEAGTYFGVHHSMLNFLCFEITLIKTVLKNSSAIGKYQS